MARELVFPRRHFSNNPLFMASFPAAGAAVSPNGTTGSMGGQPRHLSRMEILQRHRFLPPRPSERQSGRREGQVRVSGHISPSVPRMIVCCPARARAEAAGGHESEKCRSYSNPEFPFQLPAAGASFVILNCGADSSDSLPPLSLLLEGRCRSLGLARSQTTGLWLRANHPALSAVTWDFFLRWALDAFLPFPELNLSHWRSA